MPVTVRPLAWLRRNALGVWFCTLGLLGFVRAAMKLQRNGGLAVDALSWAWLGGSLLLLVIGLALVLKPRPPSGGP